MDKREPLRGTVISGTSDPSELINAFMAVLEEADADLYLDILPDLQEAQESREIDGGEAIEWFLNEKLWEAMQEIAPPGYFFGPACADSNDYGFWRDDTYDDPRQR